MRHLPRTREKVIQELKMAVRHNSTYARARCIAVSNHGFQYTPLQVGKTGDISGHGHRRRTPANGPCGAIPPTRRLYAWQRALRLLEDEAVRRAYQGTLRPQEQRSQHMRHLPRTREKVIQEFRRVGRVDLACAAAGVDRTTHYGWMKNDP